MNITTASPFQPNKKILNLCLGSNQAIMVSSCWGTMDGPVALPLSALISTGYFVHLSSFKTNNNNDQSKKTNNNNRKKKLGPLSCILRSLLGLHSFMACLGQNARLVGPVLEERIQGPCGSLRKPVTSSPRSLNLTSRFF
jgi:hypothetical protein